MRGPFGFLTWTESDGGPIGLIGAGSGVAPLASIVRYAADRGAETSMTMLCSSPDRRTALLREPLEELERRRGWFTLAHTFTRSPRDPLAQFHRRIDTAMLGEVMGPRPEQLTERYYYVAGPAEMVVAVRAMLGACGVTDDRIYSEEHM